MYNILHVQRDRLMHTSDSAISLVYSTESFSWNIFTFTISSISGAFEAIYIYIYIYIIIGGEISTQRVMGPYIVHSQLTKKNCWISSRFFTRKKYCMPKHYILHRRGKYMDQLEYIFINKKWINSAFNCEAYSFFEGVSSDHRTVSARIRLILSRNKKPTI